ncbi:MAG: hypothetical protein HQ591_01255 [candidate division Zixibacteria bacterium]|nr:hypothetical protein [Candidatus Tariuqbacter arcticus]
MRSVLKFIFIASLIICLHFASASAQSQPPPESIDFIVDFQQWAVYTFADWQSNPSLFTITIRNNWSETVDAFYMRMVISVTGCADPDVSDGEIGWGVTNPLVMPPGDVNVFMNDPDFNFNQLQTHSFNSVFEDAVLNTGSLPAGLYRYDFYLEYDSTGIWLYNPDNVVEIKYEWSEVNITQPSAPELFGPGDETEEGGTPIYNSYPSFSWWSTGATIGTLMYYSIMICAKEQGQSNDAAIENWPFYEIDWSDALTAPQYPSSPWKVVEVGSPFLLPYSYPTSEEGFSTGYYVWQIYSRSERNMNNPSEGFEGISEIFCFQVGNTPEPIAPVDEDVNSISPTFSWTSAWGAEGYHIRVSGEDDPLVENNYWEEYDISNNSLDHVPEEQILIPGGTYYWKVRAQPYGWWCDPVTFNVEDNEILEPSPGDEVLALSQLFSWNAPEGVETFEMQIRDEAGQEGIIENIYRVGTGASLNYPNDAELPLVPGKLYYWRKIDFAEGDLLGEIESYEELSFTVKPIELEAPETNTLKPDFRWEAPGLCQGDFYEFQISDADDPEVYNPAYTNQVTFQFFPYPSDADLPLIPGRAYFWRTVVYDSDLGIIGEPDDYPINGFEVEPVELIFPGNEDEISTIYPNFDWNAPYLCTGDAYEFQISDIDDPELYNPGFTHQLTMTSFPYPTDADLPLLPDRTYFWRVAVYDDNFGIIGEQEDYPIFSFTVEPLDLITPASGEEVNTLLPLFSWSGPMGIQTWELRIRDENNQGVIEDISSTSIQYPADAELPIVPGVTYYWRIMPVIDGSPAGEEEFYPEHSFSVMPIELSTPGEGEESGTLHPNFSWSGPTGVDSWELRIRDESNQGVVENIGATFLEYPADAELPLMPNETYYWQILPIVNGEPIGEEEFYPEYNFHTTPMELTAPYSGEEITTQYPNFSWDSPDLCIGDAFEFQISAIDDPEVLNPAFTFSLNRSDRSCIYPSDPDLDLLPGGTYYWKLMIDDQDLGLVGQPGEYPLSYFTVVFTGELDLYVSIPSSTPLLPQFSWSNIPAATNYTLLICTTPDISDVFYEISEITTTNYNYSADDEELAFNTEHHTKVFAYQNDVLIIESEFTPFTCEVEPPELTVTENTVNPLLPSFDWTEVPEAESYSLLICNSPDINDIFSEAPDLTGITYSYSADDEPLSFNVDYYAVTLVYNGGIAYTQSEFVPFTCVVEVPELTVTENTVNPLLPTFDWTEVPAAESYSLLICNTPDVSDIFNEVPGLTSTTYGYSADDEPLIYDVEYYALVIAYHDGAAYTQSEFVPFTCVVTTGLVLTVTINELEPLYPTFDWTEVPGTSSYSLLICNSPDINDVFHQIPELTAVTYTYSTDDEELSFNVEYYAMVYAYQDGTIITQSDFVPFTCEIAALSLTISYGDDPLHPTVDWDPVPGAASYRLYWNDAPDMTSSIWNGVTALTSLTYPLDAPALQFGASYAVWLQPLNADGEPYGPASGMAIYSIAAIEYNLTVVVPENTPLNPDFSWDPVPTTASYRLRVNTTAETGSWIWEGTFQATNATYPADAPLLSFGSTYYAWVQALDANEAELADPSPVVPFQTPEVEYNLTVELSDNQPLNPSFFWDAIPGAGQYRLRLNEGVDVSTWIWEEMVMGTNHTYPPDTPGLDFGTFYSVWVQALTSAGESYAYASDPVGFSTIILEPISLTYPVGETVENLTPNFSWEVQQYASSYEINLSYYDMSQIFWTSTLQGTSIDYPGDPPLDYGSTYYWQVQPLNEQGEPLGAPSAVSYFNTPVFDSPSLLSPANGSPIGSLNPSFTWSPRTPAPKYIIKMGLTPQLLAPFWTQIVPNPSAAYGGENIPLQYFTTYYWTVQALDDNDNPLGDPSEVFSFHTPVGSPQLIAPVNTSVPDLSPQFSWEALGAATEYTITAANNQSLDDIIWQATVSETQTPYGGAALSYGSTYYWGISAYLDGSTYGNPSEAAYFATPDLEQVSLLSPLGVTVSDLTPVLSWTALEGAANYLVEVSPTGDFSSIHHSMTIEGTSVQYPAEPALDWDTEYFWRVTGLDGGGNVVGLTSDVGPFSTPEYLTVDLIAPLGEVSSSRPQFEWSEMTGAAGFQLQVSGESGFNETLWEAQVSATSIIYGADEPLVFGEDYFWHVRALDADGNTLGQWSNTGSFSLVTTGIVILIAPVNTTVYTLTPTFSWEALEGAAKYGVMVYSDGELSDMLWSTMQVTGTSVAYPGQGVTPLEYGSTYWWQGVALDGDGNPIGDPCEAVSFTVSTALIPELVYPVGEEVENLTPAFNWNPIEGVNRFGIEVSSNESFTQVIWSDDNVSASSVTYPSSGVTQLQFSTPYWWKVTSLNDQGQPISDPSAIANFTTPSGEMVIELLFGP